MNSLVLGILQSLGRTVDVFFHRTGQGANRGPCHGLTDFHHRIEVAGRGYWEASLNDVNAKKLKLLGHLNLLNGV